MKTCIDERLAEDASINPVALFGIICKKISRLTLDGPPPLVSQVQSHTKKWLALPRSTFLMCWFHVCQNVKDRSKGKLERVTIDMIFRDLNNLHYARNEDEYLRRRS
ncbi:hypothetical protein PPTG_20663 [Phytophthora nicotianae INRA-310]|uniref:MULE transposase domain-containing protein n=1 Tax=Phytophthora nicotianae (strain INRA-310) TaxID=761204 RepID=W2RE83_PHYN3|nr:hypothetical protein PPTG_20663 [Phytophthora nicotianae INRA-310]ETN23546.1 hypothetical protein PPTG_20663 [Phytophthora nicotianae INRA-310]